MPVKAGGGAARAASEAGAGAAGDAADESAGPLLPQPLRLKYSVGRIIGNIQNIIIEHSSFIFVPVIHFLTFPMCICLVLLCCLNSGWGIQSQFVIFCCFSTQ